MKFQKVISFRGIFALIDHTYKPLAEKSRDFKDSDCQSMATWQFFQIKVDADFANSTLFNDKKAKHVILAVRGQRKWIMHT